ELVCLTCTSFLGPSDRHALKWIAVKPSRLNPPGEHGVSRPTPNVIDRSRAAFRREQLVRPCLRVINCYGVRGPSREMFLQVMENDPPAIDRGPVRLLCINPRRKQFPRRQSCGTFGNLGDLRSSLKCWKLLKPLVRCKI